MSSAHDDSRVNQPMWGLSVAIDEVGEIERQIKRDRGISPQLARRLDEAHFMLVDRFRALQVRLRDLEVK